MAQSYDQDSDNDELEDSLTCECGAKWDGEGACPSCGRAMAGHEDPDQHAAMIRAFEEWDDATLEARQESERDHDYYDGKQWTDAELASLQERGQPAIVINRIAKKINYLLGDEISNRADPKAQPRTPAHDEDVLAATDAIRYVCDDQDFDKVSSATWRDVLVDSAGGCVVEIDAKEPEEPATMAEMMDGAAEPAEPASQPDIVIRRVSWDRLWFDPHSREPDFGDAAYLGVNLWTDQKDAIESYRGRSDVSPNFESYLSAKDIDGTSSTTYDDKPNRWTDGKRQRVRIVEAYYRKGEDWWTCHFTQAGFIVPPKPTGYLNESGHHVCPLVITSAFVGRQCERYGLVRHMIGPQDEINKRRSKLLHQLSVRQLWLEEGSVSDVQRARREAAKPDGVVTVEPNALAGGRIRIESNADLAAGQANLLAEAKGEIDSIGPDNSAMQGVGSTSGRELQIRQNIGSRELASVTDNHRRWKRQVYEQIWLRVRQFWTDEKWLRVTDDSKNNGFRFVGLNRVMTKGERFAEMVKNGVDVTKALELLAVPPEVLQQTVGMMQQMLAAQGIDPQQLPPQQAQAMAMQMLSQHPAMQEPVKVGDVASLDVDIVLDEQPDVAIVQQEEYANLMQVAQVYVAAGKEFPIELLIEASQLRNKRKLLDMLKAPQVDPAQQQIQQGMMQLQAKKAEAEIAVDVTKASLQQAQTVTEQQKAQTAGAEGAAAAQHDSALAMKHAADAGARMVPAST
jgi:hypothetical protein